MEINSYCKFCDADKTCSVFEGVEEKLIVCNSCLSVIHTSPHTILDHFSRKEIEKLISTRHKEAAEVRDEYYRITDEIESLHNILVRY